MNAYHRHPDPAFARDLEYDAEQRCFVMDLQTYHSIRQYLISTNPQQRRAEKTVPVSQPLLVVRTEPEPVRPAARSVTTQTHILSSMVVHAETQTEPNGDRARPPAPPSVVRLDLDGVSPPPPVVVVAPPPVVATTAIVPPSPSGNDSIVSGHSNWDDVCRTRLLIRNLLHSGDDGPCVIPWPCG